MANKIGTIKFNLDEPDQLIEMERALKASSLALAMNEVFADLRVIRKYDSLPSRLNTDEHQKNLKKIIECEEFYG